MILQIEMLCQNMDMPGAIRIIPSFEGQQLAPTPAGSLLAKYALGTHSQCFQAFRCLVSGLE
jgi:hypothetical protein